MTEGLWAQITAGKPNSVTMPPRAVIGCLSRGSLTVALRRRRVSLILFAAEGFFPRKPVVAKALDETNSIGERGHENSKHAFDCARGWTFSRNVDIARVGSREGRGDFKVYRSGSKTISASQLWDDEQSDVIIQSLHAFRRLSSVAQISVEGDRKQVTISVLRIGVFRLFFLCAGFRHAEIEQQQAGCGHGRERDERSAVARMDHHNPRERRRQGSADPLGDIDRAEGRAKAAGPAHEVSDDDREDRAVNACADAVEKLYADEPRLSSDSV
jgi:hypothetical protein